MNRPYTTRTEFSEMTTTCDPTIDEHTGYHWTGESRTNPDDLITEVRNACQCETRGFWVPEHTARKYI